ncbi:MAG TPA: ATP-binding protein [Candidatus Angelobacter sp.]|nr:ATP-binding protein [Candidatus Angelobacter sp.]
MKIWGRKTEVETASPSVARAALAGVSRLALLREALKILAHKESLDRVGVWLEPDPHSMHPTAISAVFHGLVWDRANPDTPAEWKMLSLEPPLPEALLSGRRTVEQHLEGLPENLLIGQQVGLRFAEWIPVAGREQVRGLLLLGGKTRIAPPLRERAESLAAELAMALELEEQLRLAGARSADLASARNLLHLSCTENSVDALLSRLVTECVAGANGASLPGAVFAAIGALPKGQESSPAAPVAFHWCCGDQAWTCAMESEPLARVWRRALEIREVVGSEPPSSWSSASVARVVAFPLIARGALLGTLVAGLPRGHASLATLDRLELRALLAASALERKSAMEQESQRVSSEQAMLDLLNEPVLLFNESGRVVAASRGARELLQRRSSERGAAAVFPPEHLSDSFRGRDRERVEQWLRASLPSASSAFAEGHAPLHVQLHNGIDVRLQRTSPAPGQPAAILLQPQGATDTVGQAAYAGSELQSVIEWLEEGVILLDSQENVRAINTRFEQMVGLTPEKSGSLRTLEGLIAHLEGQAADPAHFAARWRELARGLEGGTREELQMVFPAPRILERASRPVLDSIGRQLGRVEIYRDLTAQRVFQSKLLQTEKLAALGQMVSGIAHEMSNPLTSILGYAQRLLTRQDGSTRSEEIRQIYQEADRAGAILRQLLLNARETMPERRLVSLNQIVMRALELQRFSRGAEKIRAEMDLDPALPFVYGDPGQLQQVLINLLANARQALEQQGPGGFIQVRTRRAGERRVLLEVEDSGPGIPQAIQARIFDPFFTTKPAGVGTGLGLSIVLSVVREHGGQVRVLSPPQGGTTFQLEIPAASERQQEEVPGAISPSRKKAALQTAPFAVVSGRPAAVASGGVLEPRKGPRVLVVEDEPTVARLIADVLEDDGMHVEVLFDGREALERAGRESYDLVICDMKMPGLDGQHFYQSLERTENPLRERFLFVTGDVIGAQTREFLERHRLPHVAKPFRVEELTEKVHDVLHARARPEPSEAGAGKKNAARNG